MSDPSGMSYPERIAFVREHMGDAEGRWEEALQRGREYTEQRKVLLDKLIHSLLDYDTAYEDVMVEWPTKIDAKTGELRPDGMTEERLKIATRNKMRERSQEFPEIARWRLRLMIGFRSEEE